MSIGLGFLPKESLHGVLIHIPEGTAKSDLISISEVRGDRFSGAEVSSLPAPPPSDPALRANGLATAKLTKSPTKLIPVHPSLGKELCVLFWAVEEVTIDDIPNDLRAAIADNPFVMGEGMPPKARRELLGHGQLAMEF
jgi:hypothetical protein